MHHVMRRPSLGSGQLRSVFSTRLGRARAYWREAVTIALALFAMFIWAAFAIPVVYESEAVIEVNERVGAPPVVVRVEDRLRGILCEGDRLARLRAVTRSPANDQQELEPSCGAIGLRAAGANRWALSLQTEDPATAERGVTFLLRELGDLSDAPPKKGATADAAPGRAPAALDEFKVRVIVQATMPQSPVSSARPMLLGVSGPASLAVGALWALARMAVSGRRGRHRSEQSPSRDSEGSARFAPEPDRSPMADQVRSQEPAVELLVVARGTGFDVIGSMTRVAGRTPPPGGAAEEAPVHVPEQTDPEAAERDALHLLEGESAGGRLGARVDAWQTLAVLRERRGAWASAIDARRSAVTAAREDKLTERECLLQVDLGALLTAVGARTEARAALASALEIAHRTGSQHGLRRGRVHLLAWSVTFGSEAALEAELSEIRATADGALRGGWIASDRTALGLLFYRACELVASGDPLTTDNAAALLQMTVEACRTTGNDMYLAPALGMWARAELARRDMARAMTLAEQARDLVAQAAPALPDPAPVYLALHDGHVASGDTVAARGAVVAGLATLLRRLQGVAGTAYAGPFLRELPHTVELLYLARRYEVLLADLKEQIESAD
jgi:hypothetical protein